MILVIHPVPHQLVTDQDKEQTRTEMAGIINVKSAITLIAGKLPQPKFVTTNVTMIATDIQTVPILIVLRTPYARFAVTD